MKNCQKNGFALISTLAVLVVVSVLVVAYTSTVRTERSASQNFSERERADAIGQAMVSRLLADHAAPEVPAAGSGASNRLKPFAVDEGTNGNGTFLPTPETLANYFAVNPLPGIYSMRRQSNLSADNGLVRISQPEVGSEPETPNPALTPYDWAYSRVKVTPNTDAALQKAFLPYDSEKKLITPQWVDYFGPEDASSSDRVPVGEVAFTIWDESGKFDINMAGRDTNENGMAPHNLGFEALAAEGKSQELLDLLNGPNKQRQRTNFSLRSIFTNASDTRNRTGDDRWLFSVDELVYRNLFKPESYLQLNTFSRDFDVRPEWNGDRSAKVAAKFLRSYINNPELFRLFTNPVGGPHLVRNTFDQKILRAALSASGLPSDENTAEGANWMQIMRLMAGLRQILPLPPSPLPPNFKYGEQALPMNAWSDADIWGIALNIAQATSPQEDQNLFAHDRATYGGNHWRDPDIRLGSRISPLITECAVKVKRLSATQVEVTEYFELWNPYPIDMASKQFLMGSWSGGGPWVPDSDDTLWGFNNYFYFLGPVKYGFMVVENKHLDGRKSSIVTLPSAPDATGKRKPFTLRTRPYLYPTKYWAATKIGGADESVTYASSIAPFYEGSDRGRIEESCLVYYISPDRFDTVNEEAWASFQIDDPRMGPFTRKAVYTPAATGSGKRDYGPDGPLQSTPMAYSWKFFPTSHSLPKGVIPRGVPDPASPGSTRYVSPLGGAADGYNENFGENWPDGGKARFDPTKNPAFMETLNQALDTFGLPGRPYTNLGELGTVFANRPWRTLTFASKIAPRDTNLATLTTGKGLYPTALLDYYTTIGTTTKLEPAAKTDVTFAFQAPSSVPPPAGAQLTGPNWRARKQSKIWLFEDVVKGGALDGEPVQTPTPTNLRPIRGRINLNSASRETLVGLLKAPYRVVRSQGLERRVQAGSLQGAPVADAGGTPSTAAAADYEITIPPAVAEQIADAIVGNPTKNVVSIRPLRSMADLAKLDYLPVGSPANLISKLHTQLPDPVVDAIMGRLAQFGTVRQQIFRVDMAARALNRTVEKQRLTNPSIRRVVTAEVRFQTRLYFDTFSRKAFVESIEYR